jgi:hypothetical protein
VKAILSAEATGSPLWTTLILIMSPKLLKNQLRNTIRRKSTSEWSKKNRVLSASKRREQTIKLLLA